MFSYHFNLYSAFFCLKCQTAHNLPCHLIQIHILFFKLHTALIQLWQLDNITDQGDHPACLFIDPFTESLHIFRFYKTVHHNFCISRNRGQRSLQLMGNICREFSPHLFNCCFFFILPVNSFKQRMQLFIYIIFQWFFQIQIINRCNQSFHLMPCHKPCNTCHHDPDRNHIR